MGPKGHSSDDFYLYMICIAVGGVGTLLGIMNTFLWCHLETHATRIDKPHIAYSNLNYPRRKRVNWDINGHEVYANA